MKSNIFFRCFYILAGLVLLFNVAMSVKDGLMFSTDELPVGDKQTELLSPEGDKKIEVFVVRNCLGMAVRAQCVSTDSSTEPKNIYWQTDTDIIDVKWGSNTTVNINGVWLNVEGDYVYDSRKGASIFREGALEGIAETMRLGY